jgi:hypothetical protein
MVLGLMFSVPRISFIVSCSKFCVLRSSLRVPSSAFEVPGLRLAFYVKSYWVTGSMVMSLMCLLKSHVILFSARKLNP